MSRVPEANTRTTRCPTSSMCRRKDNSSSKPATFAHTEQAATAPIALESISAYSAFKQAIGGMRSTSPDPLGHDRHDRHDELTRARSLQERSVILTRQLPTAWEDNEYVVETRVE